MKGSVARHLDMRSLQEAFSGPGQTWISIGIVNAENPEDVVVFDEEAGQPFVCVMLEPSKRPVYCRVGSDCAGNGEGSWHPFIQGDEVLVALPQGAMDAGPVIISRLNNSFDAFPMSSVAGQDPTTNTFGFRRRRTPFVEEYAGPILFRSALSEAFISIDNAGAVTLRDGQGDALQLTADVFGFQNADGDQLLQMNLTDGLAIIQSKDAYFQIASSESGKPNVLLIPTTFTVTTAGDASLEHVATTESTINLINNVFNALGVALNLLGTTPLVANALGAMFVSPVFQSTYMSAAIPASIVPATGALTPATIALLSAAFTGQPQKLTSTTGQTLPGIGCKGFNAG